MIDLHCHILPAVDDGPEHLGESLEMAGIFTKAGYRQIVATPHRVPGTIWKISLEDILKRLADLNHAIQAEGIELEVLPGMEIALDPLVPDLLAEGQLLTLGKTSYVLIETPFHQFPLGWEKVFFTILSKGYSILMAHPERCAQGAVDPHLFDRLVGLGVYLQVNWDSFLGCHGRDALRMAHQLAQSGYIHCLATDSHDSQKRNAVHVQPAAKEIKKMIGPENLKRIAYVNPLRVIRDEKLLPMKKPDPAAEINKRFTWRFWQNLG